MSVEWSNLPLLPIRCILDHLSVTNALAAMSTCRQWRQAMLLYEGKRETLKMKVKQLEQNLFIARLFRRHTRKLHIYVNCNDEDLNKFMDFVLPQFLDATKLKELIFIGPMYMQHNPGVPLLRLKRIITEILVIKNARHLNILAILGCQIDSVKDENDRYVHKQVEYYSQRLSFPHEVTPQDMIISRCNAQMMMNSTLKHLVLDYECISTEAIETLAPLTNLKQLTLNVCHRRDSTPLIAVDWRTATAALHAPLQVAVNIISIPTAKFSEVIDNVFVEDMPLVSLKVMFCNTMYVPLLNRVGMLYALTLKELVWADCPYDGPEADRAVRCPPHEALLSEVYAQVNPFVLLCWQCASLTRLVIHGYWMWQYDVVGLARLREMRLEVSSLFSTQTRFTRAAAAPNCGLRVMLYDTPITCDSQFIRDMNSIRQTESWRPIPWRRMPAGLRANSSPASRALYVFNEIMRPLGIT